MPFVGSTGFANAQLGSAGGFAAQFPAGFILDFRTGSPPGPDAAITGTAVHQPVLGASPWSAPAAKQTSNASTISSNATAAGTPGYVRIRASGDAGGASTTAVRAELTVGQWSGTTQALGAGSIVGSNYRVVSTAHGRAVGDVILVAGHAPINGVRRIVTVVDANTIEVLNPSGNAATATGGTMQYGPGDLNFDNATFTLNQAMSIAAGSLIIQHP